METPPIPPQPAPPIVTKPSSRKLMYGIIAFVSLVVLLGVSGFVWMQNTRTSQISPATPSPTTSQLVPSTQPSSSLSQTPITNGDNTVSYAKIGNEIILKYNGKTYRASAGSEDPDEASIPNVDSYTWIPITQITDIPSQGWNDVFSYQNSIYVPPGTLPLLSVVIEKTYGTYQVLVYDPNTKTLQDISSSVIKSGGTNTVPRNGVFSMDNKFVSFDLYPCWYCEGGTPDKVLVNLSTKQAKNIGETSSFNWKTGGNYEYKPNETEPCPTPSTPNEPYFPNCPKNPNTIQTKTGTF